MTKEMEGLVCLARELRLPQTLEEMLQRVANRAAALVGTDNAGVRVLSADRARLLVCVRAGAPLHGDEHMEFALGEGLVGWIAAHDAPLRSGRADEDPRFLPRPDRRAELHSFLGVPLSHGGRAIGVLSATHRAPDAFTDAHEQVFTLLAALSAPHVEVARLARLARIDPLTGALNSRALDEVMPPLPDGDLDGGRILSVAIVDIDGFRALNARLGAAVGDEVLKLVAQVLAANLRVGDAVIRFAADSFLLILPGIPLTTASRVAERARRAIEASALPGAARGHAVTASMGVAQLRDGEARDALVQRGLAALEEARSRGSNRVCLSPLV